MQEVLPVVRCGCDGTPFINKPEGKGYICSFGHEMGKVDAKFHSYCPLCMNNEYLALSTIATQQEQTHYNIVILCSNPLCPRYRVHVSPDGKFCSMFTSKHNRLFMLDLRSGNPILIYKKDYEDNWLDLSNGNTINKRMNRKIQLFFFRALAYRNIKIVNGILTYKE